MEVSICGVLIALGWHMQNSCFHPCCQNLIDYWYILSMVADVIWVWCVGGIILTWPNQSSQRKTVLVHLSTIKLTCNALGLNQSFCRSYACHLTEEVKQRVVRVCKCAKQCLGSYRRWLYTVTPSNVVDPLWLAFQWSELLHKLLT